MNHIKNSVTQSISEGMKRFFQDLGVNEWSTRVTIKDGRIIKLDLSNLGLKSIPVNDNLFYGVQEVDLSYNQLEEFPSKLLSVDSLQEVKLQGNKITQLPIQQISHLKLNMEQNPLPERILRNLEYLQHRELFVQDVLSREETDPMRLSSKRVLFEFFRSLKESYPYPFSYSQFYNLKRCRLKWFFDYFLDFRRFELGEPSSIMIQGQLFHDYIQKNMKTIKKEPFQIQINKTQFEKEVRFIENFINTWGEFGFQKRIKNITLEKYVESPPEIMDVGVVKFWMKRIGIIDMIWELEDGSLFIWDFKTSRSMNGKYRHLQQTYFYKRILESLGYKIDGVGILYPQIQEFVARFTRKVPKKDSRTLQLQKRSLDRFEEGIQRYFRQLLEEEVQSNYSVFSCRYCEYVQVAGAKCQRGIRGVEFMQRIDTQDELILRFKW